MMSELTKRVLFDAETISRRVEELGKQISTRHPKGDLLLIGILKGCFMFMADLVRSLDVSCQIDFVRVSSYGSGTCSSGALDIIMDTRLPLEGRDVILVDDIVDSGLTLCEYRNLVAQRGPRSLETAALIDKTGRREKFVELDYCGFKIEHGFIVGYGLDCDEQYRGLGSLYVLE
jgi:hypoxanthine phosphoribosyltransferase